MKTKLTKADLVSRVTTHFGATNYTILTQTESSIVVQNGKDINWPLFIFLLLCITLIGGIIYWAVAKTRQIVVNFTAADGFLEVSATGNTKKAQAHAAAFLTSLPSA
jgi:plastocyanin domain-containing protein